MVFFCSGFIWLFGFWFWFWFFTLIFSTPLPLVVILSLHTNKFNLRQMTSGKQHSHGGAIELAGLPAQVIGEETLAPFPSSSGGWWIQVCNCRIFL